MMRSGPAMLTAVFLLLGMSASAFSQNLSRSRQSAMARARSYRQSTQYRGAANRTRDRLGTFQTNRYRGVKTRTEQLDEIIRSIRQPTARRESELPPTHPMRDLLDRRNLLSPRSSLATRSVSYLGRNLVTDASTEDTMEPIAGGGAAASAGRLAAPPDANIDLLFESTSPQAEKYYELGVQAFRKGDYIRAGSYFDLDRDIHYDQARPYLAGLLTAYQHQDLHQAYNLLKSGLKRAKSLDDLKLDRNVFFEDPREFTRALNDINIWAKSQQDVPAPSMILAYYSWLNGDHATTLDAVDAAMKCTSSPEDAELFQRFRDLLTAQPASQP